jgi:hypothetical protein
MASNKSYAYYIKGNKLALVQRNSTDSNATGESYHEFKSPTEAITNGIEIEYTRAPWFEYDNTSKYILGATIFLNQINVTNSRNHLLFTKIGADNTSLFAVGDYVFIKGAGKWSGLHKIQSSVYTSSNTYVTFETRVHDDSVATVESGYIYTYVTALKDEDSEIQLSSFLTKAAVYYVKAKLAEDGGQLDLREYFMKEYRKILSRHEDSRITGMRKVASFGMNR